MVADALTDTELTELLGVKCPSCGWRGGRHRPQGQTFDACPEATAEPS